jgi:putative phosphoesterase
MKIALIGDVHANLPALEAVLTHARQMNVKAIWNVGDFVGYGAYPDEVVKMLREIGAISIIGNYDSKVLRVKIKEKEWGVKKIPEKWLAFQWAYENLSPENRVYLSSLPEKRHIHQKGWHIQMTHGSPATPEEHLGPDTSDERLYELVRLSHASIILCGHSHQPFTRWIEDAVFINPGSVGRPDDGDPRASYAIIKLKNKMLDVSHYRVDYDVERAAQAVRDNHLPEEFAQMILQGRSLDGLEEENLDG